MTDTPSLALLKGQNADTPTEDAGIDGPIEQVQDIKKASAKALENLLTDNDTTPPAGWSSMKLAEKRAWVLAKFEADAASEDTGTSQGDDATLDQTSGGAKASASSGTPPAPPTTVPKEKKSKKAKADAAPQAIVDPTAQPVAEQDQGIDAAEAPGVAEDPPFDTGTTTNTVTETVPAAPTKPAKAPKAKKGTAVANTTKSGEIVEPDLLQDIVHEVENMKKDKALELVADLSEQADIAFFRLGGILSLVSANGWWQTEDNKYPTFRAYIEQEHGLEYRKATYWIAIYNALANSGVPWTKIKEVGWTKLKEIAKILTIENVDEWVDKAKAVNTLTLHDMVKKEGEKGSDEGGSTGETEKVTTKTFKVHAGQKEVIEAAIKKAKEASNTDVDTMALEYICQDYLAGSGAANSSLTPSQQLAKIVKSLDLEVVMHVVDEAFPDFDFVVDKKEEPATTTA